MVGLFGSLLAITMIMTMTITVTIRKEKMKEDLHFIKKRKDEGRLNTS